MNNKKIISMLLVSMMSASSVTQTVYALDIKPQTNTSISNEKLDVNSTKTYQINNQAEYELTAVDPTSGRGANQLIVYSNEYGETTGTNDYGYEVQVNGTLENGEIVSSGGNNSKIPSNGYVLSGHGTAATFLVEQSMIGAKVKVDTLTGKVIISVTPSSLLIAGESNYKEAETTLKEAKEKLLDIPVESAENILKQAKVYLEKARELKDKLDNIQEGQNLENLEKEFLIELDKLRESTLLVKYRCMESKAVEGRGVWHRPKENNLDDVKSVLEELKRNNINMLYLETFYHGYTIYPSKANDIIEQNPLFKNNNYGKYGNDILKAFVEEGKKYGIEVHAWVQDFFVGYEQDGNIETVDSPILSKKPQWTLLNYDNTAATKLEGGQYYFMDPSNPEVRQFLLEIYSEMVSKYNLDGIQLDYIRYPVGQYKGDNGYNESSMNRFKEVYSIEESVDIRALMDKDKNADWEMWHNRWYEWKQENITTFVGIVNDNIKKIDKETLISTAIFPNIEEAKNKKMQNWPKWVENGYIDLTAPMAYYKDSNTVKTSIEKMVQYVDGNCLNYGGIAPTYLGLTPENNALQIKAAQEGNAQGFAIFASQSLLGLNDVETVLKESTNRNNAVTPHSDLKILLRSHFDEMQRKAKDIYLENNAISKKQYIELKSELDKISKTKGGYSEISSKIDNLKGKVNSLAKGEAVNRIVEDLDYINVILKTRANIEKK